MDTSLADFKEQFKFGLVEVVYEWARGMPFNEITDLTDVQEGEYFTFDFSLQQTLYFENKKKTALSL